MTGILWTLAGIALKSAAVLALGAAAAFLMRRRPAATRHLVWTAVFASILAIPVFTVSLPEFKVPAPGAFHATEALFRTMVTGTASPPQPTEAMGSSLQKTAPERSGSLPLDWRTALLAVLSIGCGASLLRMIMNWMSLWSACRKAQPFTTHEMDRLRESLGLRQPVDVRVTEGNRMPMVFGFLRPAVLLPGGAQQWPPERLRVVLLHEFAHVRRGDVATQWMARLALALYWWNPLVGYAWRAFLKEREHATDDLVLSAGEPATDYANHLLEIARGMQAPPAAAVAMARKSQLEDRLMAILNSRLARAGSGRTTVMAALLLAAAISAPLASLSAQAQQQAPLTDIEGLIRRAEAGNDPEPLKEAIRAAERERRIDIALALAQAALPLQATATGEASVERGRLLLKLGDLQRRRGRWEEALATYQNAIAILGDRPETADAVTYFGIRALIKDDFAAAQQHLERAQTLSPEKAGAATMWMAMLRLKQNDLKERNRSFRARSRVRLRNRWKQPPPWNSTPTCYRPTAATPKASSCASAPRRFARQSALRRRPVQPARFSRLAGTSRIRR